MNRLLGNQPSDRHGQRGGNGSKLKIGDGPRTPFDLADAGTIEADAVSPNPSDKVRLGDDR